MSGPPVGAACEAPFTTLHLDPHGVARICCENKLHHLGRIPQQSLTEIWAGAAVEQIRSAVTRHDLTLGCEGCASGIESGRRGSVRAGIYDHLAVDDHRRPQRPIRLELELSNRCNLACVMCNGELSSTIRTKREARAPLPSVYDDAFFVELASLIPTLHEVTFLGGEPFLGPEPLRVFDLLLDHGFAGACHVTTNGTVVNDRVRRLVEGLRIDIAVSVDGHRTETFERIRVGADHAAVLRNIAWFRQQAEARGTTMVVHYCLLRENWHELRPFLAWADDLDIGAHVIPVRHPLRFSLDMLDADALTAIAEQLAEQDATTQWPLIRNRAVWDETLVRLRHLASVARQRPEAGAPVSVSSRSTRAAADLAARESVEAWADERGASLIVLDVGGCITEISPDPTAVVGIDMRARIGGHATELMDPVNAGFGRFAGSRILPSPPGTELRSMEFEGPTGWTTVRSLHVESLTGRAARIHIAARPGREHESGSP